jgi:ribonuclease P protein component
MRGRRSKPEGFPKEERVRRTAEYTRILRDGTRVRGRFLNAYWVREAEDGDAVNRVGVAAGKKLGNAVRRNLLKRRIREAYRRNKRELSCGGIAIVFVASSRMIGRGSREVEDDVIRVLHAVSEGGA